MTAFFEQEILEPPPPDPLPLEHTCVSPIIVDVGGDGYHLTSINDGVVFDLRNEGQQRRVAWTRAQAADAFLALDRDGDGRIGNGGELFGNFTKLRSGTTASNGFEALAELDDNRDAIIDARDAAWPLLLLWTDGDHDGVSAPDELLPIASSPITALGTDYQVVRRTDRWQNYLRSMAHYWTANGAAQNAGVYYDVFLQIEE
jgi:hypothetical protein